MDAEFWHRRWREDRIAFHEGAPNDLLVGHVEALGPDPGARIFVPLCGKAVDLDWLLAQGYRVVGVELNRTAVEAVFERLGLNPKVGQGGALAHFETSRLEIHLGDFLDLTPDLLGPVDAVFDRGALVALPQGMRDAYAAHLAALCPAAPQLLVSYDYDQARNDGPPFAVPGAEIERLYGARYGIRRLERREISGPLAERCTGSEEAWLLSPR